MKFFVSQVGIVFWVTSDNLVIVISTAVGLSGVYSNSFLIGLAGLMVAIAASLNTIVTRYFFVRTESKMKRDVLERIKLACACAPEVFQRRIERYMKQKNYDAATAKSIALAARERRMIDRIIAQEEYGITEKALGDPVKGALFAGGFKY